MIQIYRKNTIIYEIEIDDKSSIKSEIMGEEIITLNFTSDVVYKLSIGDYLIFNNCRYILNTLPKLTKTFNDEYSYVVKFESIKYELGKILFNLDGNLEFDLNTNANQFLIQLVYVMNNSGNGNNFITGVSSTTTYKNFNFSNESCLSALNKICKDLEVEYEIIEGLNGITINIRDAIGVTTDLILEYKKGILSISEESLSEEKFVTKLHALGGSNNIPDNYGSKKIKINPLFKNSDTYGIIEGIIEFEDIYPNYNGIVNSVSGLHFSDSNIDFDLNNYLVPGLVAKVVFRTGNLAGYEFEISGYNHSTHTITLNSLTDDIGQTLPNTNLPIEVHDTYTFVDIYMPQSYVDDAEEKLLEKATTYINKYSVPVRKYAIAIDNRYMMLNDITLNIGDKIRIYEPSLDIDETLRIYSITKSLTDKYSYNIELTNDLQISRYVLLLQNQYSIENRINALKKQLKIIKNN